MPGHATACHSVASARRGCQVGTGTECLVSTVSVKILEQTTANYKLNKTIKRVAIELIVQLPSCELNKETCQINLSYNFKRKCPHRADNL